MNCVIEIPWWTWGLVGLAVGFGRTVAQSGPMADAFLLRYSTKYMDPETGLSYYGYRYYSPQLGRWLTRDPLEEDGGINLYGFCGNDGVNRFDVIGLYVLRYHKAGIPPPNGWDDPRTAACFIGVFRHPEIRRIVNPNGLVQYKVDFIPQQSYFDMYLTVSYTMNDIRDELQHLDCALIKENALGVFKDEVEEINDCPDVADEKYKMAADKLIAAERACDLCNDRLDAKGGPHGH